MAKDWEDRLTETVNTIATAKLTKNASRQKDVSVALSAWLEEQTKLKNAEAVSGFLTLKGAEVTGADKAIRDLRRALMLLHIWRDVIATGGMPGAKSAEGAAKLADGKLADAIGESLGEVFALMTAGSPAVLNPLFDEFKSDPLSFLQEHPLTISGDPSIKPPGKKVNYRFWLDKGTRIHKLEALAGQKIAEYTTKPAWIIPVTNFSTVKDGFDALPDSPVGEGDLAFTTQFTGCCYCFQVSKDRKSFTAAHIDPEKGKGETGQSVSKKLREGGKFATGNDGKFYAFGRVDDPKKEFGYGDGRITIAAVKGPAGWEVFAQVLDGNRKVVDARKIFDPKKKDV